MKRITVDMLEGACRRQRSLFKRTFPTGAPVTMAAAKKARKVGLSVWWIPTILPGPLFEKYVTKHKSLLNKYFAKRAAGSDKYYAEIDALLVAVLEEVRR